MTEMSGERYLGDGVYASFDGFHIRLRARDHEIYLEPHLMIELRVYIDATLEEFKKKAPREGPL